MAQENCCTLRLSDGEFLPATNTPESTICVNLGTADTRLPIDTLTKAEPIKEVS